MSCSVMSQYSLPSGRRPARKSLAALTRSLSCGDPRTAQGVPLMRIILQAY
jgi:hypothetical protein